MSKHSISDNSELSTLETQLKDNLYIGGAQPSAEDALVFEQFNNAKTEPNQETHPNLWSWFSLISLYEDFVLNQWKQSAKKEAAPKKEAPKKEAAPKKEEKADEMDDLFGDDGDDAAALEELKKKMEADKKGAKKKEPVVAKSIIILDVKVWETDQDLDALAEKIIAIQKDGLMWKTEYKKADVAFGVQKLVIGCVVEDEKVSIDDIIDELQSWEDDVQSVDIVSFNKI